VAIFSFGKPFSKKMSLFWEQDFEGLLTGDLSPVAHAQWTPPAASPEAIAVECAIDHFHESLSNPKPSRAQYKKGAERGKICKHGSKSYLCKQGCYHSFKKCHHNTTKYRCIICSPHLKCEHESIKSLCTLCAPPKNCAHKSAKHRCKKCSPHLNCVHDSIRSLCKFCNTVVFCKHLKRKNECKYCTATELNNAAEIIKKNLSTIQKRKLFSKK
jgi:hypothetical protein